MSKQIHIHIHRNKAKDAWSESDHPRASNGQFGSGGGGGAKKAKAPAGAAPSKGQAEGGTNEQDRKHFLNVVRDPKNASTEQLREAIDYWHEVGTNAGHGGQEHAASQQRMRMAVTELQARGEKVPGFDKPEAPPAEQLLSVGSSPKFKSLSEAQNHLDSLGPFELRSFYRQVFNLEQHEDTPDRRDMYNRLSDVFYEQAEKRGLHNA